MKDRQVAEIKPTPDQIESKPQPREISDSRPQATKPAEIEAQPRQMAVPKPSPEEIVKTKPLPDQQPEGKPREVVKSSPQASKPSADGGPPPVQPAPPTLPADGIKQKSPDRTSPKAPAPVSPSAAVVQDKKKDIQPPNTASYWLGRKPDASRNEYVFDVAVPPDLAAVLLCSDPRYADFRNGVKRFQWESGGKVYVLSQNPLASAEGFLEDGRLAFARNNAVARKAWTEVSPKQEGWKACEALLKAQATRRQNFYYVTPLLLESPGPANPRLTLNFDTDRPYDVRRDPLTKSPQIVPLVQKGALQIAWQGWSGSAPSRRIGVTQIPLSELAGGRLAGVRTVDSLGTLVGFAVGPRGKDYVLTARAEDFPNQPEGDFVERVHKQWRPDTLRLYRAGQATELNSDKFADWPVYGVTNAGTGRLVFGNDRLAAIFARRCYGPDGLIHQLASDLLMTEDLGTVDLRAGNAVSHSFDQRLIFDGTDFVTLNQGDQYPCAGLIIEKVPGLPKGELEVNGYAAYTCPTLGNDVFFELGGLAAERDGYPILFTSTRNTAPITTANLVQMGNRAWDIGLVYVRRDFDRQPPPKNGFDIVGSGILADGYAADEKFKIDNFTWNKETSKFDKLEPRVMTRRVFWLTKYPDTIKATQAKFVKLREGQYVALWEEHERKQGAWSYRTTCAQILRAGKGETRSFLPGQKIELPGLRLHAGDDAVSLTMNGKPCAAWVTAGATNRQLFMETLDEDLRHQTFVLRLP